MSGPVTITYDVDVCTGAQDDDLTMVVRTPMTDLTGWVVPQWRRALTGREPCDATAEPHSHADDQRGAIAVTVALLLIPILVCLAFVVDVGAA